MKNVYIYPYTDTSKSLSQNPYVIDFCDSISKYYNVINKDKYNTIGILDIFKNIFRIDYVFFNWIEDIGFKKHGKIQFVLLLLLITILKIKNIKIVWTLHNKQSHLKKQNKINKFLINFFVCKSDYIITHSEAGVNYAKSLTNKNINIRFFHHPVKNRIVNKNTNPRTDILIWGAIAPYKGIDLFLEKLHSKNKGKKYNISIIGKVSDQVYENKINQFVNDNIKITNKYVEIEELIENIKDAKIVLFTYEKESVLSSGALIDSISFGANIIGPDIGSFKDLNKIGLIDVFTDLDYLVDNLDEYLQNRNDKDYSDFINNNSWSIFSSKLFNWISHSHEYTQ